MKGRGSAARFQGGGNEDSERSQEPGDPGESGTAELLSWVCFSLAYLAMPSLSCDTGDLPCVNSESFLVVLRLLPSCGTLAPEHRLSSCGA